MKNVPLRKARIYSDYKTTVVVTEDPDEGAGLRWSGGACFFAWQELSVSELHFRILQLYVEFTQLAKIPVDVVHKAFCNIPEYRETLAQGHPDLLTDAEFESLKGQIENPGFSDLYSF